MSTYICTLYYPPRLLSHYCLRSQTPAKDDTLAMEVEKTKESTSSIPEKTTDAAAESTKASTRQGKRVAESVAAPGETEKD